MSPHGWKPGSIPSEQMDRRRVRLAVAATAVMDRRALRSHAVSFP